MKITPVKDEASYQKALERLEKIFDAPSGSPENDEAEILVTLISKYEDEHYAIEAPDPIEAIKIVMDEKGLKIKDIMKIIGTNSRGTVSNILNKKRPLTLPVIRNLEEALGLPYDILVKPYVLKN